MLPTRHLSVTAMDVCNGSESASDSWMATIVLPEVASPADPVRAVQEVLKCKWVMLIMGAITRGHRRPSAIERSIAGLSHKILHQRLRKLMRLRLIERIELGAKAQQVEYRMTRLGVAIGDLVSEIEGLRSRFPADETLSQESS
jgi:DNA-binding HxlR family transcriptional regulator